MIVLPLPVIKANVIAARSAALMLSSIIGIGSTMKPLRGLVVLPPPVITGIVRARSALIIAGIIERGNTIKAAVSGLLSAASS